MNINKHNKGLEIVCFPVLIDEFKFPFNEITLFSNKF
jgi:hypothetical protein